MKNKIFYLLTIIFLNSLILFNVFADDQFSFDVTEIEILDKGNIIKGYKKGIAKTSDGIEINGDNFIYNKKTNILKVNGNIKIQDLNTNSIIYADHAIYDKNEEIITTKDNSKAIDNNGKIIHANNFKYKKNKNILNAQGNVKIEDTKENYLIFADDITYYKDKEKIITSGKTEAIIKSKYKIQSKDVTLLLNEEKLKSQISSENKTKITDSNFQAYFLDKFRYLINRDLLKGDNLLVVTNYGMPKSDKYFFKNAIVDLKKRSFVAKDTEIKIHNSVFDNSENNPRLKGVSSNSNDGLTVVNKGIFTSCKDDGDCPPWSLQAKKITHDKNKKQLLYDNAVLKIYDIPVLYFPKFFHPDPSVERQTGFLKPAINNSNILGNSLTLPYFKVISQNKDFTLKPTLFDRDIFMSQLEYRQINKNSNLIADLGFVNNYKNLAANKKKNLSHLFADFELDLQLDNYNSSDLSVSIERISNNSYLKVFDSFITKSNNRPQNLDKLNNNIKLFLNHEDYDFETGIETFETLDLKNSDRYQYILPYYNFSRTISQNYLDGNISLYSSGSNELNNTNNLKTNIINDLAYDSKSFILNSGFVSSNSLSLKNLNSIGKKTTNYKSKPQVELTSLFSTDLSLPLIKENQNYTNLFTPRASLRFNPSDMKDYSSSSNKIDVSNIFSKNRLGLSDSFESGNSLTLGVDFKSDKKNSLNQINNYFEFKLATVLRDKEENFIPKKSTLNKKSSNLFGLMSANLTDNFQLSYNFSLDNDYKTFEYNDINATFTVNNIVTKFNFIEENGETGNTNILSNSISYNIDDKNFFTFNTRRNRKLNLTEYYDLVYEYKNDCLTAGIKYKKNYYSDDNLKPSENLLFTITLIPLTTYEYQAKELVN